jgi:hypothetical protein
MGVVQMRKVYVWDRFVRAFHSTLVVAFTVAFHCSRLVRLKSKLVSIFPQLRASVRMGIPVLTAKGTDVARPERRDLPFPAARVFSGE